MSFNETLVGLGDKHFGGMTLVKQGTEVVAINIYKLGYFEPTEALLAAANKMQVNACTSPGRHLATLAQSIGISSVPGYATASVSSVAGSFGDEGAEKLLTQIHKKLHSDGLGLNPAMRAAINTEKIQRAKTPIGGQSARTRHQPTLTS